MTAGPYWYRGKNRPPSGPKGGRPRKMPNSVRVSAWLPAEVIKPLEQLGNGNISEGLRRAVVLAMILEPRAPPAPAEPEAKC